MDKTVRSCIAEFLGTFALVFIGTSTAVLQGVLEPAGNEGILRISFAFGFTLMVLVWVIGPISGCHLNPAVTIPMALSKRLPWNQVPGYIIAQCAGAIVASGLLWRLLVGYAKYTMEEHGLGANGSADVANMSVFLWEVVLTALFLFTIFASTRSDAPPGIAAFAIGGFLLVAHLVGAQLGDSSLNPARSLGPAIYVKGYALEVLWVFVSAPIVGGILGWLLYKIVYAD